MADIKFRGIEEGKLRDMDIKEFRGLLKSRQKRSLSRGMTEDQKKLLKRIKKNPGKFHKTRSREMIIVPQMLDTKIGIHNGKEYVAIDIKPEMLGHRLGEFAVTRKKVSHSSPGFGATRSSKFVPLK